MKQGFCAGDTLFFVSPKNPLFYTGLADFFEAGATDFEDFADFFEGVLETVVDGDFFAEDLL